MAYPARDGRPDVPAISVACIVGFVLLAFLFLAGLRAIDWAADKAVDWISPRMPQSSQYYAR